jgi:acetone carboxylase gamma subunit
MTRIDIHLEIQDGEIVCTSCGESVCETGENYKLHALYERKPLTEAGPLVNNPKEYVDDNLEFRQFYCPNEDCVTLLENEIIKVDHEPVHDKEIHIK